MEKIIDYKDIKPMYSIDYDTGEVKNIKTGRILSQKTTKQGYKTVTLYSVSGKQRYPFVHRLYGFAFCEGYEESFAKKPHLSSQRADR